MVWEESTDVDLRAVYAGRVRPQQLLASGETPFVIASGSGAVTSHVLGVKDQVIVALLSTKLGGGIFAKSEIKRPEDLKGKLIATGRPGALNDILVRYVLTRKWGLSPDRDVKLMPIGEPPLMLQALERGVVDATSLSVPASFVAKSKGFFELVNYDALGLDLSAARCNHAQTDDCEESTDGREGFEGTHRGGCDF